MSHSPKSSTKIGGASLAGICSERANWPYMISGQMNYTTTTITSDDYPELVSKDAPVKTVAVGTVLLTYNWPTKSVCVAVIVTGCRGEKPLSRMATVSSFYDSSRWQAHATFTSDDLGSVDVSRQAPISGTYDGISPMGLVWSAERLPGEAQPVSVGSIMRPLPIEIEALSRDGRRAPATLERYVAGRGVTRHPIRSEGIVGTLFVPSGAGPHPAVLVVSGGGGGIDEFRGAILASHGYAVLALGHFGLEGLPRGLVNIPLEYFENAIGWMRRRGWLTSWRCGDRREVVNWHFCSVLPSPRSMR